ncbi:hypothetical protein KIF53_13400 [Chromobacterium subtsugae]|uniref:DUF3102 domain-containing protein n=1 Tax=Chromobacterium subtsugae TaxID=251747 RepID=A0ABS7FGM1_9NEIS|nr:MULTISPECIES: hypothetical protein [Chromobacterium]KUM03507.1 hypothetical protein Cv017_19245 [Chromobacterium subtsugae]KZE87573.1 hypothetical protein AWB61_10320 [Chromobacterium sp. F49]MBW7567056.1 hypothetical protein [Chromobacterium subtsugae]MBW8288625.1 hypothetical protein [Chromobacterium subtsugae]WSE90148.1 hypothetical protein U6115_14760 [Chromobacterium subtsugae]
MARTKTTETPAIAPAVELRQDAVDAANVMAIAQASYGAERDLVNQLLGQAQMAGAFEEFSRTVRTSKLAYVKENKLYRTLAGKKAPHGAEMFNGTWEEFCHLLGRSVDQVDRDIANLRAFGEEALESMSRMGIGYRELRQFRKLPEDQKTALIEVAKAGDKESFVELAEEIIAKHTKEKEALAQRVEEAEANLEARSRVLQDKSSKIDQLTEEVAKLSNPLKTLPWDKRVAPFQQEITQRQSVLDAAIAKHLEAVKALDAWLTAEITQAPDYDPEMPAPLPPEVRAVLLHLDDAVTRTAMLAAELRDELRRRFAADIEDARRNVLTEGSEA